MITLGERYQDKISGYEGIAIGRTEYSTGCIRVGLQARMRSDGTLPEAEWFDEQNLEHVMTPEDIVQMIAGIEKEEMGGPMLAPKDVCNP